MLVVDYKEVLIASKGMGEDYIGTFSYNKLLVQLISEHIHHDINLMKLNEEYSTEYINGKGAFF